MYAVQEQILGVLKIKLATRKNACWAEWPVLIICHVEYYQWDLVQWALMQKY